MMNSRFQIVVSLSQAIVALLICLCVSLTGGCKKSSSLQSSAQPSGSPSAKQVSAELALNACSLLTKEEIQEVQGSPITDTKSSDVSSGSFRTSQCYYAAVESSKSVSLAITQSSHQVNRSVRDYFKETFGGLGGNAEGNEEEAKQLGGKRKEEEERRPPKKIGGVGEEAFWFGNRVGGALYVLKRETIVRVSVGGADTEEGKINKSKTLAEKAVSRL